MACHFIKALNITSLTRVKQQLHGKESRRKEAEEETEGTDEEAEGNDGEAEAGDGNSVDELDIDTNMEVEPSADDADALREASVTDFEPGDVVGKMMALIAQLRSCGEDTRDYLKKLGDMQGCPQWEIKLWIRTRWGSLSDCFRVTLALQKVDYSVYYFHLLTISCPLTTRHLISSVCLPTLKRLYHLLHPERSGPIIGCQHLNGALFVWHITALMFVAAVDLKSIRSDVFSTLDSRRLSW
jgi:hypothetical protein